MVIATTAIADENDRFKVERRITFDASASFGAVLPFRRKIVELTEQLLLRN